jgi:hypothetical protein
MHLITCEAMPRNADGPQQSRHIAGSATENGGEEEGGRERQSLSLNNRPVARVRNGDLVSEPRNEETATAENKASGETGGPVAMNATAGGIRLEELHAKAQAQERELEAAAKIVEECRSKLNRTRSVIAYFEDEF